MCSTRYRHYHNDLESSKSAYGQQKFLINAPQQNSNETVSLITAVMPIQFPVKPILSKEFQKNKLLQNQSPATKTANIISLVFHHLFQIFFRIYFSQKNK